MNRVGIADFRGADDAGNVQVTARALGRADADGLVGEAGVQAVPVGLRIHGDGADPQILARADDAQCDFPAVGDQDFLKHCVV